MIDDIYRTSALELREGVVRARYRFTCMGACGCPGNHRRGERMMSDDKPNTYDVLPDDFQCEYCQQNRMACLSDCSGRTDVICAELVSLRNENAKLLVKLDKVKEYAINGEQHTWRGAVLEIINEGI